MNGLRSYLSVYGWLQAAAPWQGALLPWCGDWKLAQKNQTFWYCGRSSVSSGLSCRRSHIYRIEIRDMQIAAQCLKLGAFYWDWHTFSLKLWVFFHVVYCDDKKKIFCSSEYVMKDTNQIASLLLSLTELILLAINIGTSNMTKKHTKTQWMH